MAAGGARDPLPQVLQHLTRLRAPGPDCALRRGLRTRGSMGSAIVKARREVIVLAIRWRSRPQQRGNDSLMPRVEFTPSAEHSRLIRKAARYSQNYALQVFVPGPRRPATVSLGKTTPERRHDFRRFGRVDDSPDDRRGYERSSPRRTAGQRAAYDKYVFVQPAGKRRTLSTAS